MSMFYIKYMILETIDFKKLEFTSPNQFLLGEEVIIINSYSRYYEEVGIIKEISKVDKFNNIVIYIEKYNTSIDFECKFLDLNIKDELLYNHIKNERFSSYQLLNEYKNKQKELLKIELINKHRDILDVFEEVYPNSFDFNFNDDVLSCIIYFPEINITNEHGLKHKIVDLYLCLKFNIYSKKLISFQGTRSTLTLPEMLSSYRHSHISSSGNFYEWLSCCFGNSEFAQLYSLNSNIFDINNLTRFLYQIPEYLSWESLEGGPYKKIADIKLSYTDAPNNNINDIDIKKTYIDLISNVDLIPIEINNENITTGIFEINNYDELQEIILPFAYDKICNKSNDGRYFINKQINTKGLLKDYNDELVNKVMFTFKGNEIKPKVIETPSDFNEVIKQVPYPSLTNAILQILTNNLNNYVISEANQ